MQIPIPDDWDGSTWECYLLSWPKSVQWTGILWGLISTPSRGRFWDGRSGSIIGAQAVGEQIIGENGNMDCDALITVLQEIRDKIADVEVTQQSVVTVTQEMSNNVVSSANATANAFAWSSSYAAAMSAVKVINQVELEMRPLEPGVTEVPQTPEAGPTSITSTAHSTANDEVCKRVFWTLYAVKTIYDYWYATSMWTQNSILGFLGAISAGLAVAALKGDPEQKAILVPASVLISATHKMVELYYEGLIQPIITDLKNWLTDDFDLLWCNIYENVAAGNNTLFVQSQITGSYLNYSSESFATKAVIFITLFFNLTTLAAMYYVSSLFPTLPDVPNEFGGNSHCVDNCGG